MRTTSTHLTGHAPANPHATDWHTPRPPAQRIACALFLVLVGTFYAAVLGYKVAAMPRSSTARGVGRNAERDLSARERLTPGSAAARAELAGGTATGNLDDNATAGDRLVPPPLDGPPPPQTDQTCPRPASGWAASAPDATVESTTRARTPGP